MFKFSSQALWLSGFVLFLFSNIASAQLTTQSAGLNQLVAQRGGALSGPRVLGISETDGGIAGLRNLLPRRAYFDPSETDGGTTRLKNLLPRPVYFNPAADRAYLKLQPRPLSIREGLKWAVDPRVQQTIAEADLNAGLQKSKIQVAAGLPPKILHVTASAEDCSQAEKAMRNASSGNQSGASYLEMWSEALASGRSLNKATDPWLLDEKKSEVVNAIIKYNHSCLAPLSALNADSTLAKTTALIIGVLLQERPDGWAVQCSATRVASNQVLTAKHCFYSPGMLSVASGVEALIAAGKFKFMLPDAKADLLVVGIKCLREQEAICRTYVPLANKTDPFSSDFVLLEVMEDPKLVMPTVLIGAADLKPGATLMLAGWNTFAAMEASHLVMQDGGTASLAEAMQLRLSRAGTCTLATIKGNCLTHTCQATPGSSGGALFRMTDGGIEIVGLHVAPTDANGDYVSGASCDLGPLKLASNFYTGLSVRYGGNIGLLLGH